ncbi:MAG: site-specific integrase [Acidobacteria bacterium]|nr:site-specific integrase [Acidobacteriota bacterium]
MVAKPANRLPSVAKPKRFTVTTVADLDPRPGVQYVAWDTEPTGFGVRVSPSSKAYVFKYRTKAGRVRWATLGRVEDLALDQARDRAFTMRGQVAAGKDPLREIDASRGAVTVRDAAARWLAEHVATKRKPRTLAAYTQIVDSIIVPKLGTLPLLELGTDDAVRLHHQLRGTKVHANRTLAVLASLLAWCVTAKLRPAGPNPCQGIERYTERPRRRYLTAAEYAKVGRALRAARKAGTIASAPLVAIELLLLTGARPAEIAALEWAHVDLAHAALRLPDSKTGAKTIHLSPEAAKLLKKWPRWAKSAFVFAGRRRGVEGGHMHGSTLSHTWEDLRAAAGIPDCRLYDACRHSYASEAVSKHGLTLAQVGEQLGHTQAATTKRYAHLHDEAARQNAMAIGGSIAKALRRRTK